MAKKPKDNAIEGQTTTDRLMKGIDAREQQLISLVKTPTNANLSLDEYAGLINAAWHKTVDAILEVARLCVAANSRLRKDEKEAFFEQLVFSGPTFSKLVKIGNNKRIQSEDVKTQLPSSYSTIYEIAKLDEDDLKEAIDGKKINPDITREEMIRWIKGREVEKKKTEPAEGQEQDNESPDPIEIYAAAFIVYLHKTVDQQERNTLVKMLKQHGEVLRTRDEKSYFVSNKVVVRMAQDDPYLKHGHTNRFSDQHGNLVHENGDWIPPKHVLRNSEEVTFDPLTKRVSANEPPEQEEEQIAS